MKKKDLNELRNKKISDLVKLVKEKKLDLTKSLIKRKTGGEKNLKKAKNLKLEIARILTIVGEKEIMEKEKGKQIK